MTERQVYSRRARLEREHGEIKGPAHHNLTRHGGYPGKLHMDVKNGIVVVGSDAHYRLGECRVAHRGFCYILKELKPLIACLNGDVKDGAMTGRHPRIMWESRPNVRQELQAIDERLTEVEEAAPRARRIWTLGNHDARFETRLSAQVPEFEGVKGFSLADHFPKWEMAWSLWLNLAVVIKHRFKSGVHATHNNTVNSGLTMVTGHLHSLKVTPFSDYRGTRFGVDTGTLDDPYSHLYTEENPLNHRAGFVVLTFKNGELLWPEVVAVVDENHIQFRGEIIKV